MNAGLAVAQMKGKSYLSVGYASMGIAGSMVNPEFFQEYLGMRTEFVDMSEIRQGSNGCIMTGVNLKKQCKWIKEKCQEGPDPNKASDRKRKEWEWETVVKMTHIFRDLMIGNPRLAEMGFGEEARGRNAIAGRIPGTKAMDRFLSQW